jgi:hypothetical protein
MVILADWVSVYGVAVSEFLWQKWRCMSLGKCFLWVFIGIGRVLGIL